MKGAHIFPWHSAVSLPYTSEVVAAYTSSLYQQLQAAFLEDLEMLSLETSLSWPRENWQKLMRFLKNTCPHQTLLTVSSVTTNTVLPGAVVWEVHHLASHQALEVLWHIQVEKEVVISQMKPNKIKITAERHRTGWDRGGGGYYRLAAHRAANQLQELCRMAETACTKSQQWRKGLVWAQCFNAPVWQPSP